MCGIAGAVSLSGGVRFEEVLHAVGDIRNGLLHRGPDDSGGWDDSVAGVALGHTRLKILDLSPAAHQPMVSASGRYVLVYNGEIYNHEELRSELAGAGVRFRGHGDTEVLLEALAAWGIETTLQRLNGMFAFAAWDRQERCLHLARDRAGEKPLYYTTAGGCFYFGSELGALSRAPRFDRSINRDVAALYLAYGYVPEPWTIYRQTRSLSPGESMVVARNGSVPALTCRRYWSARAAAVAGATSPFPGSLDDAADELEGLLQAGVRKRLVADVPVGATLSGGIDSSTVVATMSVAGPAVPRTFTVGFHESSMDESAEARAIAAHLGTDHTELRVSAADALDLVPAMPGLFGQPFGDSSQIPSYIVCRAMRSEVTVALTGDGGDELFGGYDRYVNVARVSALTRWAPAAARQWTSARLRTLGTGPRRNPQHMLGGDRAGAWAAVLARQLRTTADLVGDSGTQQRFRRLVTRNGRALELVPGAEPPPTPIDDRREWLEVGDRYQAMALADVLTYLPSNNLVKMDRSSMAHGLEIRAPLLDPAIIDFALSLPASLRVRRGVRKRTLRRVLRRHLPAKLIQKSKRGFTPPVALWLRGPLRSWAEDLLSEEHVRGGEVFDAAAVRALWTDFLRDPGIGADAVWDLLMFQGWLAAR